MSRPRHTTILDEIGMRKSMPANEKQFEWRVNPTLDDAPVVFLGLGPEPDKLPEMFDLSGEETIYFLESPAMVDQIAGWENRIPANFQRISPEEFTTASAANTHVVRYLPSQRAFPSYFGPLTARLTLGGARLHKTKRTVWLPFSREDLLGKELAIAFERQGFQVYSLDHEVLGRHPGNAIPEMLGHYGVPDLFFSVNFKGIDHYGLGCHILREAGVKVGVWMVDNPFNLLTSVKSGYWKDIHLFTTDHTFIGPLIDTGARWVKHLPLAACPELFENGGSLPDPADDLVDSLVFVGRSEFPKKQRFFAGLRPDDAHLAEATAMLDRGERPHYHWWRDRVPRPLWPGNDVRQIGIGAEVAGYLWRTKCLTAVENAIIYGDEGWQSVDGITADVRPPVDYYATLPAIYRTAGATLNVTGMQLPAGLTQRHFDVWCAGGFLITDNNPGLRIFPDHLTRPVTFDTAEDIQPLFRDFLGDTQQRTALRNRWRELILAEHTYHNRVRTVLESLNIDPA